MDKPYTVALLGWPELPAPARIAAEVRFIIEFERALGGLDGIAQAYAEQEEVIESLQGPDDLRPLHTSWARSKEIAALAGWRGLPERPSGACFRIDIEGE